MWRGATNAVNEFGKTSLAIDQWVSKNITGGYLEIGGDEGFINWVRGVPKDVNIKVPESLVPDRSRSTTGQLIEGVSQFVTGLLTLGKFTAPIKGIQTLGTAGRLAFSAAKGAVVDLTVFDAYEDRLSNLIQEHPDLANPVTEYLASNEDDSALKARFKAAVEGAVLGGIADTFVEGLRVLKSSRALRDAPDAARAKAEQELIDTLTDADAIINRQADAKFDVVETKDGFRIVADGTSELHPQIFTTREAASAETGVLNMLELDSKRMRAPGKLTDEEVGAIRKETQRLLESDDPEDIAQLLIGTDFNFRYARNEKGALAFIEAISKVMKDEIGNIKGGTVVTHERLLRQVKSTFPDGDPQKIMTALSKTFKNSETLNVDTAAGRIWMHKVGMEVSRLSKIVDGTPDSPVAMDQLGAALDHLFAVQSQLKGVSTNVARTLEAHKIDPTNITDVVTNKPNPTGSMVDGPRAQQIAKDGITSTQGQLTRAALAGMTPDEMRVLARRVRLAEGDPNEILAITRGAKRSDPEAVTPGFIQKFNEFWINGILSGPTTHTVNVVSGLQMALATPLERVAAGVISRDKRLANEGADLLIGNFMSIRESFRGAGKALRTAQNALDPSLPTNELTQDHALGGYLGKLARLPSRFLMAEDEFFKQMNFRSNVRAQALKDARELGLTGTKFAEHVSDTINSAFTPSGLGANKKALDFARKQTFTQPLREGSLAQRAQSAVNDMPALRLVLPFVRTPTNLIHYTWERTPVLRKLHRQVREELAAGGERAAIQQAKLGTGLAVYTGAASLALAGQITGRGPENDGLRKQWLQTHQPYSVKAGDRWVSYRRGDPLMAPVGIVADIVGMGGELDADSAEELATAVASSIAANLSSKTYLQGIVNVMDTLTSGSPNKTGRFLRSFAGSIVPNVLNVSNPDDPFREVRGYVDSMMARTPGLSNPRGSPKSGQ